MIRGRRFLSFATRPVGVSFDPVHSVHDAHMSMLDKIKNHDPKAPGCEFVRERALMRCLECHRTAIPPEVDASGYLIGPCLDKKAHDLVSKFATDALARQEKIARWLRSDTRWSGGGD